MSRDLETLLTSMFSNRQRLIQINLMGEETTLNVVWVLIGIFSAEKLGITRNEWWKKITDQAVLNEVLT